MVVGFLRSSNSSSNNNSMNMDESRAQQQVQMQVPQIQAPAQTMAMHHQHLQLQSSHTAPPPLSALRTSTGGNHAVKRPFQELPRLHVPSHALAQQAQPMWKTGSVIMPSSLGIVSGGSPPPPPPAAPRFQFFTNTVGGWFGRNNAPAKTLPSFHEVLARTNQLQIVGQEDPENAQQQQHVQAQQQQTVAADIDMLNAQQQQQLMDQQQQQQQQVMNQQQQQQEQMHHQLQQMQLQQQQQQQHFQQQQQQIQQLQLHEQHQQQGLAMQFPPTAAPPSYTAFAPQAISMQANEVLAQRPSLSVVNSGSGATEAPSPMSLASPAASQTGDASKRRERWTEDEHARFMEGLNRYGRKWKKIQTFVQTKTAVQVRTHAYGYFAKLLRNMPEDDGVWELAEEMSSLPGAVLKGPGNGKRRNEPKTDEQGMDVLRRFVFSKKKTDDKKAATESDGTSDKTDGSEGSDNQQQQEAPYANWSIVEDSAASSAMLELKRQRIM